MSSKHVGLSGHSSPQCWANSSPVVYVVLALDSWNYCSGEQGPTSLSESFPHGFTELEVVGFPEVCHLVARQFIKGGSTLVFNLFTLFNCITKIVQCHRYVGLLGLALNGKSSNYLVLTLHRQLFVWYWGELWPDSPTCLEDCRTFSIQLSNVNN